MEVGLIFLYYTGMQRINQFHLHFQRSCGAEKWLNRYNECQRVSSNHQFYLLSFTCDKASNAPKEIDEWNILGVSSSKWFDLLDFTLVQQAIGISVETTVLHTLWQRLAAMSSSDQSAFLTCNIFSLWWVYPDAIHFFFF